MPNLAHKHYASREGFAPIYRPSPRLRVQDEINAARTLIPRGVKLVGLISQQDFSACRKHPSGGFIGKTIALVVMRPDIGYLLVAQMQSALRRTACRTTRPLSIVLSADARADAAEDVAQDDLRAEETIETLDRFIEAQRAAIAAAQEALDAAVARKAELEPQR